VRHDTVDTAPRPARSLPTPTERLLRALVYAFSAVAGAVWALVTLANLEVTDRELPGAGAWPLFLSCAVVVCSLVGLVIEWRAGPSEDDAPLVPPTGRHRKHLVLFVGSLLLYYALLPVLGFLVASVAVLFACQVIFLAPRRYWRKLAMALVIGLVIHLLFTVVLNFSLPQGVFGYL
jgi:hypothetical protein